MVSLAAEAAAMYLHRFRNGLARIIHELRICSLSLR